MSVKKVLFTFGTRPEAIKLAPVILALRKVSDQFECELCGTAQHRQMLDQVLSVFGMSLDYDLKLMRADQEPSDLVSRGLPLLMEALAKSKPDLVLVQGDTVSTFLGAYAAFLSGAPAGHVEAGLRTFCKYQPFPEEINRRLTGAICDFHFAPTARARENLLAEGVSDNDILLTGNTVVDALMFVLSKSPQQSDSAAGELESPDAPLAESSSWPVGESALGCDRLIVVTAHRRESFGEPLRRICLTLKRIASEHPECLLVYPMHPNPNVRSAVEPILSGVKNVKLVSPMGYSEFVALMKRSYLILTDSGGIQEEAPSLGKPVLVLRDRTERPEGQEAGVAILVGSDPDRILAETNRLLTDEAYYQSVASRKNPYGDGRASERIVSFLKERICGTD